MGGKDKVFENFYFQVIRYEVKKLRSTIVTSSLNKAITDGGKNMPKIIKYDIYTDASFDNQSKIATYAIVVMFENKILKSFSKASRIKIKNSTEIETFAVYQAINLILSCYINKNENQIICINTDCAQVPDFFQNKKSKVKIFQENEKMIENMKKAYNVVSTKLSKKNSNFILKWISRNLNKVAHKQTYNMLKRVRKVKNVRNIKEDLLISKNVFCSLLSNCDKNQYLILIYLLNVLDNECLVKITQKEVSEKLKINLSIVNKNFKKLIEMEILAKIKNGIYMLLI